MGRKDGICSVLVLVSDQLAMDVLLQINFDRLKFNVFLFPPSKAQLTGDFAPYAKRSEMFVALPPIWNNFF